MEKLNQRNIKREGIDHLEGVLLKGSIEQVKLTEEYILPNQELIVSEAESFRVAIDKRIKGSREDAAHHHSNEYPVGRCQEINTAVLEDIIANINNPSLASMRVLRKFVKEGGIIRRAWCIKDATFQNAIQIGNAVLDVANDTADKTEPPVVFIPDIRESDYRTIATIENYADVAEEYWGARVYPNIYLPALAPLDPVILRKPLYYDGDTKKPTGMDGLFLDGNQISIASLNLALQDEHGRRFDLTRKFLTDSRYSSRRLPKIAYEKMLEDERFAILSKQTGREFFVTDDADATLAYIDSYYHAAVDPDDLHKQINGMLHVGRLLSQRPLAVFPSSAEDPVTD